MDEIFLPWNTVLGPTCPLQHRANENIASQPTFWKLLNLNQKHNVSKSELLWTHCIKSDIYTMREMCNSIWVKYNFQRTSTNRSRMKFHKLAFPHIQIATSKIFKLTLKAVLKLTVVLITGSGGKPHKGPSLPSLLQARHWSFWLCRMRCMW